MDSKLELFLNKVNLSKEDYKYFNDAKLLKIIASKDKKNWNFVPILKIAIFWCSWEWDDISYIFNTC